MKPLDQSAKAVRQADQVLIVGDAESTAPETNAPERSAFDIHPSSARRLVLLHKADRPICGTSRWLDLRPFAMHHHLVLNDDASCDHLAPLYQRQRLRLRCLRRWRLCAAH